MSGMTNTTNPALKALLDNGRQLVHEDMRAAFVLATGHVLPSPGDRVSWTSRFAMRNARHTGVVEDVYVTRDGFKARIEDDRSDERPHRTIYTLDVYALTYHTGCATVGRVADEHGRLILTGGGA